MKNIYLIIIILIIGSFNIVFSQSFIQLGIDINGEAAGDNSGYSVSLSSDGNRVAIGAIQNGNNVGHVRVYSWNGTNQHGELAPAGLYLSRIVAGNEVKTSKLMLLK